MKYIIKKIGVLAVTLFVISALSFFAFQIVPGDPASKMLGAEATPERLEALREELGLNVPAHIRYLRWLAGFVTGDFGRSYSYNIPVSELVGGKIVTTAALSFMSFFFVVLISVPAGFLLARYEGSAADRLMSVFNQITMSVPPFFTGIIFTLVFGLILRLFTPGGFVSYTANALDFLVYLIFPALAIAIPKSAMTIKMTRGSILGEMGSDYVRTAYSRGNSRWDVLKNHVMRNAVIPVITFLALTLTDIVAGSIIIEQVFAIPGIGRLLLLSISNRDFQVVQTITVIIAFFVIFINFLTDIVYQYIDPRIRLS